MNSVTVVLLAHLKFFSPSLSLFVCVCVCVCVCACVYNLKIKSVQFQDCKTIPSTKT